MSRDRLQRMTERDSPAAMSAGADEGVAYARTVSVPGIGFLPPAQWQRLEDHLLAVAEHARVFAKSFGAPEWAYLAGLWHDLGKYHPDFQRMLREVVRGNPKQRVDHSTAGARHAWLFWRRAVEALRQRGVAGRHIEELHLLVTVTIAGHHAGLADGVSELESRMTDRATLYEGVLSRRPPGEILTGQHVPALPSRLAGVDGREFALRLEFLVRMVFSTLVDADRLDAARVADQVLPDERRSSRLRAGYSSIGQLREALDRYIDQKVANLRSETMGPTERRVFAYRQEVLVACRQAAEALPGAFALDVATGGGKTLSSLSFALRHAGRHGKDRVIVVIPYTSIIEQTAEEYRRALGDLEWNVVEHHSATNEDYERADEVGRFDVDSERRRFATENWDAPLIVTTAVQFFESLFASTPSRCRKLHNIANSVVVVDEVQMLPPGLLTPTVWALNELVEGYGVTIVLSTATQPALEPPFPEVRNVRSIAGADLERPPARVRVEIAQESEAQWVSLARELASHSQVLCITHLRRDARDLTLQLDSMLGEASTIHLSAAMCAAHRSERIERIRSLLAAGAPCRVISTQLVEAGVDLDFPVVYRSLAGLDSLVQAAGRANREGKLGERGGLLRVYQPPTKPPLGLLRLAEESARLLFEAAKVTGRHVDIFAPEAGREFFRSYYEKVADKDAGTTALRVEFRFSSVAMRYRFIKDGTIPVVVPWGEQAQWALQELREMGPSRERLRRLQRYTVSVYPRALQALIEGAAVEPLLGKDLETEASLYALRHHRLYDPRFGLDPSKLGVADPEDLIG